MLAYPKVLLGVGDLSLKQIHSIIELALVLKKDPQAFFRADRHQTVALAFFEPSTRTQFSFMMAAHRLGVRPLVFNADASTSVSKGESLHETLETLLAMKPDALVIRHSGQKELHDVIRQAKIPVLNAGDGVNEHPTQALLDAVTIIEKKGSLKDQKILFVGDVEHSRVATSCRILFSMLGAQLAVCAPQDLLPTSSAWKDVVTFQSIDEAMAWCTVCMGLRLQKERHRDKVKFDRTKYIQDYRIDAQHISSLAKEALILHPGPFVSGEDLNEEILKDSRCMIHEQVTNGVFVRAAILTQMLGLQSQDRV